MPPPRAGACRPSAVRQDAGGRRGIATLDTSVPEEEDGRHSSGGAAVALRRRSTTRTAALLGVMAAAVVVTAAGASPANVDVELNLGATSTGVGSAAALTPSGGTATVTRRDFAVHAEISLITASPGGRAKLRFELGGGLRWGADDPDPTEGCTSTATTADCQLPDELQPLTGQSSGGWSWNAVAPQNGTYTFSGGIVELAQPDPVPANNSATITIVVNEETGGGTGPGGGGSGGGGGGGSVVSAAVKVTPSKPKAGATLVATSRVTRGGAPIRPSGVACSASVGGTKLRTAPKAASGIASCLVKTPKSARGKRLTGTISFRAGGRAFRKPFAARLG